MEELSHALRCNQCWETVHFGWPFLFDGGLVSVAKSLDGNTIWRVFDLDLDKTKHVEIVTEALREQKCWKYFILRLPKSTPDQGVEMLANLLKTSPSWERFVLHLRYHEQLGPWLKVGPAILQERLEKHWNSLVLWLPSKHGDKPDLIKHLPFQLENHQQEEIGVTAETALW